MKKFFGYTLSLLILFSIFAVNPTVNAANTSLTVNKTTFTVGEEIIVTFSDLDASLYGSEVIELRLYKTTDVPGTNSSTDYVVIHSSTVDLGSSGTIHLPNDGAKTAVTSYAAGNYKIMLLHSNTSICDPVYITITGDISFTTNKAKYEVGEDIIVSYSNVAASLAGTSDIEVRLYPEGGIPGSTSSTDYFDVFDTSLGVNKTPSGTITFPSQGARHVTSYSTGRYKVMLLRANTQICNAVSISIGNVPEIQLEKTYYVEGEDITVNYMNVSRNLIGTAGWVEIGLFKQGDVVGTNRNQAYFPIYNSTTDNGATGTFIISADYMVKADFDFSTALPVGKYFLALRGGAGGPTVYTKVEFEVIENPTFEYGGSQIRSTLVPYFKDGSIVAGQYRQGLRFCFKNLKNVGDTLTLSGNNFTVLKQSALVILKDNLTGELTLDNTAIQSKVKILNVLADYTDATGTYKTVYIYNIPELNKDTVITTRVYYECEDASGNIYYFYGEVKEDSLRTVYDRIDAAGRESIDIEVKAWFVA